MKLQMLVDVQKDFMNEDGALYVPNAEDIKENILKKNSEKVMSLATRDWHEADDIEFKDYPSHCVKDTEGAEFIDGLRTDIICDKVTTDIGQEPYFENQLMDLIEEYSITEIDLMGVALDICVKGAVNTLIGYVVRYGLDLKINIIKDCVAGLNTEATEELLTIWETDAFPMVDVV